MGWSLDTESKGTRFDSRPAQVIFGSLVGHVGVTFSLLLGCVGMCLGVLWGCFRMVFGGVGEKVWRRSKNQVFQKGPGVFFPHRAAPNYHFGTIPGGKYQIIDKLFFCIYFFIYFL